MNCWCCPCSFQVLGTASQLAAQVDLPPWQPRLMLTISQLGQTPLHTEFDFLGVLVWVGEVHRGGPGKSVNLSENLSGGAL
jgi:hypothetical protein